jgi:exonuclease VII small subunit
MRTDSTDAKSKRLNPIKRKKLEERVRELEQEVARAEVAITACESALQNFVSAEETARVTKELAEHRTRLQACITEWEELSQTLQA